MIMSALAGPAAMSIFAFAMVKAGLTDLTTMQIRNRLVLLLLGSYAALAPLAGLSASEVGWSVAVAAGVLALGLGCFAAGWMGGGDVKLAAATALWLGVDHAPIYLFYTAALGGLLTLLVLQFRIMPLPVPLLRSPWVLRLHESRSGIPYGVAMAVAALIVFPQTRWMTALL